MLEVSRKGNCWDNFPTERLFRSFNYEQLNMQSPWQATGEHFGYDTYTVQASM